jgi:hypothetical protein
MDYGSPKILPATGGGILAVGSLTDQLVSVAAIGGIIICSALLIRLVWRRKQSIGQ